MIVAAVLVSLGAGVATTALGWPFGGEPVGDVRGAVGQPSPAAAPPGGTAEAPTLTPGSASGPTPRPTGRATPPPATPTATPGAPDPATLTGYRSPLPRGRLTLPFGPSPWGSRIVDGEAFHDGIDLATFCGDRIVAAHAGTVLAAGRRYDEQMGWVGDLAPYLDRLERKGLWSSLPIVVVIDDGNGYRSVYAHFGKVEVRRGDVVRAGQLLGYEGRTGRASGCHLHYGLFSPLETATFGIDPDVVRRMKVPPLQIARIDPLLVLPEHAEPTRAPSSAPSAAPGASASPTPSVAPSAVSGGTVSAGGSGDR